MAEAAQPEVRLRGFLSNGSALRFSADPACRIGGDDACPRPRLAGPVGPAREDQDTNLGRFLLEQICTARTSKAWAVCQIVSRVAFCRPPLHAADKGPVDAHAFRNRLLAQAKGQPELARVPSKGLANIHPQDRRQSRILALRVIIRGRAAPLVAAELPYLRMRLAVPN